MKKTILMALAIVAAIATTSCKSSKTLTDAAEVVSPADVIKEVAPAGSGVSSNVSSTTTTQTTVANKQPVVVGAGDRQENVSVVNAADASLLKDYNVVVGSFGQKSNAENYKNTMVSRNYRAFLVQNASGLYRVVAGGYDSRETALSVRDQIRAAFASDDPNLSPKAWLLIPIQK